MREGGGAGVDIPPYEEGYNVADYLLEISSESPDIPSMTPGVNILDEKHLGSPTEEKDDGRKPSLARIWNRAGMLQPSLRNCKCFADANGKS
jgi:hypothetical protein